MSSFLEATKAGDLTAARKHWGGPSTLIGGGDESNFVAVCQRYASFDSYELRYDGKGKGKYYLVWFEGVRGSQIASDHWFYVFAENGVWLIARGPTW